eukprot:1011067-Ditylum_brightwellii.AAC.1
MKAVSKDYIPQNSEIITANNVKALLMKKLSNNILKELTCKIYTTLVFFVLLRNSKAIKIQDTSIAHNKHTMKLNTNFLYASKHREKGFSFYLPKYMYTLLNKHKKQLANHGRFLKSWSDRAMTSELNTRVNNQRTNFSG